MLYFLSPVTSNKKLDIICTAILTHSTSLIRRTRAVSESLVLVSLIIYLTVLISLSVAVTKSNLDEERVDFSL